MYPVRNANLETLKLQLGKGHNWEKHHIPVSPTPQLPVLYPPRNKLRTVKNGIPLSAAVVLVMTVQLTSMDQPARTLSLKRKRERAFTRTYKGDLHDWPESNTTNMGNTEKNECFYLSMSALYMSSFTVSCLVNFPLCRSFAKKERDLKKHIIRIGKHNWN